MLRQEELDFIKAIFTLQLSPGFLKELRTSLLSRNNKKAEVSAGSRGTALRGVHKTSQRLPSQHAGKRKTNELASSGDSNEPANRRPAPGTGSAPLPAFTSVTGEQAAFGSRQLGPPEKGVMYTDVLAGTVATIQPSGSLKPTAMDSDLSEPAVSWETANRRMSSDMSGPLSDRWRHSQRPSGQHRLTGRTTS
jgi:hypothetical protein